MGKITVYSQNVGSDKLSEELIKVNGMEKWTFDNRIGKIIDALSQNIDVVAFNEIRYRSRVKTFEHKLEEKGFEAKSYYNNLGDMTFYNTLAVSNTSQWERLDDEHKWVGKKEEPFLSIDKNTRIEGDKHGRCAGIFYLRHKVTRAKVCVLVSHVVPVGEVKKHQQNALMSANRDNLKTKKIPTIIAGDFNRFPEETDQFEQQLIDYQLIEAVPTKMVIPNYGDIKESQDIGTFTPWPIDKIYKEKINKPMKESRLDVQLYTKDEKLIKLERSEARAVMFKDPNKTRAPSKIDKTRFILDQSMASDHLALVCAYTIFGSK